MAKHEWLYCSDDWSDLVNIIKLEKNCNERLREFHDMIKRDGITTKDIIDEWYVIEKSDIKNCANELFYDYDLEEAINLGKLIYWFFNIYTGEALHINYCVTVSSSDIIID